MSSGAWGRRKQPDTRDFFERAFRRPSIAFWDAKWHALSTRSRKLFVEVVKGPGKNESEFGSTYSVAADRFPDDVLEELTAAGLIQVRRARSQSSTDRVIAPAVIYDFATRVRALRRMHLLHTDKPSEFQKYLNFAFIITPLVAVLNQILESSGIYVDITNINRLSEDYLTQGGWPSMVANALDEPLAQRIVAVIQEAKKPLPICEVPGRLPKDNPEKVRFVLDQLIARLALVEDLDPETWDVVIGFLPKVGKGLIQLSKTRVHPPLVVCEHPKEVGPNESLIVNDLRVFLLEIVGDPPSLRQDSLLFQKEVERFHAILEPMRGWLERCLGWRDEFRLNQALGWARALGLVEEQLDGKKLRLHLATAGHRWVSANVAEQHEKVYHFLGKQGHRSDYLSDSESWFFSDVNLYDELGAGDMRFLGEQVTVLKVGKAKSPPRYWDVKQEDHLALRRSLDQAFSKMEPGRFYKLDELERHLAFQSMNPLNLGLPLNQVVVFLKHRTIPPLQDQRDEAGRVFLDRFVKQRLIPTGAFQVSIDDEDQICVARGPGYDALFGRKVDRIDLAPGVEVEPRVVVQPDFSVIIIGLNPTPAVELAPFCERATQRGSQGAMILKITRDSVVKAVSNGLKPALILERLKRHASNGAPANVLREVEEWSNWVRRVSTETLTVLRCPNKETGDRVMAAVKSHAERVSPTLIAFDPKMFTTSDRQKLRSQGILVEASTESSKKKSKPKAKKSKRW